MEIVHTPDIFQQTRARSTRTCLETVEINFLSGTVVRSQPHYVTLVGDDINDFVLSKESAHGGIALPDFLASLDRERDVLIVTKIETDHRVGDPRRAPIHEVCVHPSKLRQVVSSSLPLAGVIKLGAIPAIADVVNDDRVPAHLCARQAANVRLPVSFVGWSQ